VVTGSVTAIANAFPDFFLNLVSGTLFNWRSFQPEIDGFVMQFESAGKFDIVEV
jgi:hypothetical protein